MNGQRVGTIGVIALAVVAAAVLGAVMLLTRGSATAPRVVASNAGSTSTAPTSRRSAAAASPTSATTATAAPTSGPYVYTDVPSQAQCPKNPLVPGPDATSQSSRAARAAVPSLYPDRITAGVVVVRAYPAVDDGLGQIAYQGCGSLVGSRTWIVELSFPTERGTRNEEGDVLLARVASGWVAYFRY